MILNHIFEPKNNKERNDNWTSFEHKVKAYSVDLEKQFITNLDSSIKIINVDVTRFNVRLYYTRTKISFKISRLLLHLFLQGFMVNDVQNENLNK